MKITKIALEGDMEQTKKLAAKYKINLTNTQWKLGIGRKLCKAIMQKWLNASESILEMVVLKLPSPRTAQKYRVKYLYEGPQTDAVAKSIAACNPNGELCMFVSKMIPTEDYAQFYAFGRVFSGKVTPDMNVRV